MFIAKEYKEQLEDYIRASGFRCYAGQPGQLRVDFEDGLILIYEHPNGYEVAGPLKEKFHKEFNNFLEFVSTMFDNVKPKGKSALKPSPKCSDDYCDKPAEYGLLCRDCHEMHVVRETRRNDPIDFVSNKDYFESIDD